MRRISMKTVSVLFLAALLSSLSGCSGCDSKKKDKDAGVDGGLDGGPDAGEDGLASGGIVVENPDVRACDLMLDEAPGTQVKEISFSDEAEGKYKQRSPRVSVSFHGLEDAEFEDSVVKVKVGAADGQDPAELSMPGISVTNCFGKDGKKVGKPDVSFQ